MDNFLYGSSIGGHYSDNITIKVFIEATDNFCRLSFNSGQVKNVYDVGISDYDEASPEAGYKVTLYEPVKLFEDYKITEFLLDDDMYQHFLVLYSEALERKSKHYKNQIETQMEIFKQ